MSNPSWKRAVFCLVFSGVSFSVFSQYIEFPDWEESVRFELIASQVPVRPGDRLELAILVEIDDGYHLYGPEERKPSRTEVILNAQYLRAGETRFPPVVRRDLAGLGEYDLFEGNVSIRIPVKVLDTAPEDSEISAQVEIKYQVCTDSACSPPNTRVLSLLLLSAGKGLPVKHLHGDVFATQNIP